MSSFEPESIRRASRYLDAKRLARESTHKRKTNWLERVSGFFRRALRLF